MSTTYKHTTARVLSINNRKVANKIFRAVKSNTEDRTNLKNTIKAMVDKLNNYRGNDFPTLAQKNYEIRIENLQLKQERMIGRYWGFVESLLHLGYQVVNQSPTPDEIARGLTDTFPRLKKYSSSLSQ